MRRQRHDLWGATQKNGSEWSAPTPLSASVSIVKLALTAGAPDEIFEMRQSSPRRCALRLRSAGGNHRKPFLLGATRCIFALRRCKAGLDRVPERQRHGVGL
jgi:hypothetical protein